MKTYKAITSLEFLEIKIRYGQNDILPVYSSYVYLICNVVFLNRFFFNLAAIQILKSNRRNYINIFTSFTQKHIQRLCKNKNLRISFFECYNKFNKHFIKIMKHFNRKSH